MSNCKFIRTGSLQTQDIPYSIKITCTTCEAKFLMKDSNILPPNIKLTDLIIEPNTECEYDTTKYLCPGDEYLQNLEKTKQSAVLAKLPVRKGSVVKTSLFEGKVIKYNSNIDMWIEAHNGPQPIKKSDIIEVITY
jgi:hypothetical protein